MVGKPYGAMWSIVKLFLKGRSVQTHNQAKKVPAAVARMAEPRPKVTVFTIILKKREDSNSV